ncbi:hypothetical protein CR513_38196, partial [Mucuna pruriens]
MVKYQQHRQKLQQCATKEGKNGKGNVYELVRLSNKLIHSTCIQTNLIKMSIVEQLEEMHKTIHKLNNKLITKEAKKKSLEEKVMQLMHNHEE